MKLFIADDEFYVLEMLKRIIDWNSYGINVVGTATDGNSALESICTLEPDIIITDIRMPGCDGLVLIERAQQKGVKAQFIIISGYKDFQYAQNAIKLGVKDYLLKPINIQELTAIVERLVKSWSASKLHCQKTVLLNKKINKLKNKVQNFFIDTIIKNKSVPEGELAVINAEYMTAFQDGLFQVFIIKVDCAVNTNEVMESLLAKVVNISKKKLHNICFDFVYTCYDSKLLGLINFDCSSKDLVKQILHDIITEITQNMSKFETDTTVLGAGNAYPKLEQLYDSFVQANEAIKNRIFAQQNQVIFYTPPEYERTQMLKKIFFESEHQNLQKDIESSDFKAFQNYIQMVFLRAKQMDVRDAELYWQLCLKINALFWDTARYMCPEKEEQNEDTYLTGLLEDCKNIESVQNSLISSTLEEFYKYFDLDSYSTKAPITIIKRYIKEHYAEKLMLDDMAKKVHLNSVYLSILFKKEVGINFIDYVNGYRIENSKNDLKEIIYSISEIANKVGISDPRYFSKLFKKFVGVTPTEYRKKHI